MKLQYECMHTNNHPTKISFDLILPEIFLTTDKKLNKLTTKVRNDFPEYHNLIDVDTYRLNNKFYYFINPSYSEQFPNKYELRWEIAKNNSIPFMPEAHKTEIIDRLHFKEADEWAQLEKWTCTDRTYPLYVLHLNNTMYTSIYPDDLQKLLNDYKWMFENAELVVHDLLGKVYIQELKEGTAL